MHPTGESYDEEYRPGIAQYTSSFSDWTAYGYYGRFVWEANKLPLVAGPGEWPDHTILPPGNWSGLPSRPSDNYPGSGVTTICSLCIGEDSAMSRCPSLQIFLFLRRVRVVCSGSTVESTVTIEP